MVNSRRKNGDRLPLALLRSTRTMVNSRRKNGDRLPLALLRLRGLHLRGSLDSLGLRPWCGLGLILRLLGLFLVLFEHCFLGGVAKLRLLCLLLFDVIERHPDNRLLNLCALLRSLLAGLLGLTLLVLPAPVLRPRQLDGLDALPVQADHLVVEEELDLAIPLAEADPATRVDAVLTVGAKLGFDHHGAREYRDPP